MNKLNLGSGNKIMNGYINLDSTKLKGVDVVHNLDKYPWPFKNDYFDEVYADNVFEHLDSIIKPIAETWRISKKNAIIKIIVPYTPSVWAFCDPTHKQFYTFFTLDYFTKEATLNYYSKARFKIIKKRIKFNKYLILFEWLFNSCSFLKKMYVIGLSGIIPAMFLEFELKVEK